MFLHSNAQVAGAEAEHIFNIVDICPEDCLEHTITVFVLCDCVWL